MNKKRVIMFFCLVAMVIMLPVGLLGVTAVIWSTVDIFRQTAEISIEQFNKPIFMGFGAYLALQTFARCWSSFKNIIVEAKGRKNELEL